MSNVSSQLPIATDDLLCKDVLSLSLEIVLEIACMLCSESIANVHCSSALGNDNSNMCLLLLAPC